MNAISWISKEAKRLRKANPRKHIKYTGYVKDASAQYRKKYGTKSGGSKKKKSKRVGVVASKKTVIRTFSKPSRAHMPEVSLATMLSRAKSLLADAIGNLEARKFKATTKTEKRRLQKEIAKRKITYNKLR